MTQSAAASPMPDADAIRNLLRAVIDPEAGMNIVDLGLVYGIEIAGDVVRVVVTMTSPACPMGAMIIDDVQARLRAALPAGARTEVELTWAPPWDPSMMSEQARRHFGW
jgi:metal-sulfur cluster biosynthetic enzyme